MANRILNVSIANAYLKQLLESDDILSDCWIQGEVSERFEARSGHIYFTIVDGQSTLKSVIFRSNAMRQRGPFRDGDEVVAHGRLTIYEQRSQYQLIADSVQPAGQGLQALQLELLRQKLDEEGLFDPSRKRPLPEMPRTIGVVTSADGAVWHDIQNVLKRRYPLATVILAPAQVQGEGSAESLVKAFKRMIESGLADVVIIGRGGGSAEDLAAFNDEALVRAIFASPIPVISAVGHETDWSLTDLVADVRASTPSAAAEIVAPSIRELSEYIQGLAGAVQQRGHTQFSLDRARLAKAKVGLRRGSLTTMVDRYRPLLQYATIRVAASGHALIERSAGRTELLAANGRHQWRLSAAHLGARIHRNESSLHALDPRSIMQRGFALVTRSDSGSLIRSVHHVQPADAAIISVADGDIAVAVENTKPGGIC